MSKRKKQNYLLIKKNKWYTWEEMQPPDFDDILVDIDDRMIIGFYQPHTNTIRNSENAKDYSGNVVRWRLLPK